MPCQSFYSFLVHAKIAFAAAKNPFLADWIFQLRPSYDIPSDFTLTTALLPAEEARVLTIERGRLQARKMWSILLDGWEDAMRRSVYATIAVERGQAGSLLNPSENRQFS